MRFLTSEVGGFVIRMIGDLACIGRGEDFGCMPVREWNEASIEACLAMYTRSSARKSCSIRSVKIPNGEFHYSQFGLLMYPRIRSIRERCTLCNRTYTSGIAPIQEFA